MTTKDRERQRTKRRVLVLGGTGWLGGAIVRVALARGDHVVCLARGESGEIPEGATLVCADRRSPGAYAGVAGHWDEVIELAHDPTLVASALDGLADRAAHWTLVSTVSVYADTGTPGADERAELIEPQDLSRYPDAKVAAERATTARLADRLLIIRPGLIAGPGDPSDRLGYWPARLWRGGDVLVPRMEGRFVQCIDVDDLAGWIIEAGARELLGIVDAVGESHSMRGFLEITSTVTEFTGELVEIEDEILLAHSIGYWAGPRSIPLWLPLADSGFARRDGRQYLGAGGSLRPLVNTVGRTLDYERARGFDRPRRSGLDAAEEQVVLAAARRKTVE
ncbi:MULTISPECIES: NAD-dependent epimerase/dehydratase family protein [unclassified Brevibacterium]|uniref:NAD-dependent epimerase/dehydratase family protein n=1 Tax=unclassified Brevibacterium TaxID=2614124 RepID=UPI001E2A8AC9|nr:MULTISPECIES: NAD-dependent epimerase/dehydratase family protein [unclassified Brevibacterium]MCD1286463.1 reductase [Brevibacterium sp. CCUG 69071]MDK8433830.1 reductase [Brevibacterium sp. H-BE7]